MNQAKVFLLCCSLFALSAQEALAHGSRVRVGVVVGSPFYWSPFWDPYPWYPYPPLVVASPPPPPPVYIEQGAPADNEVADYWYYCDSARGYYPAVANCPEPWLPVAPRPGK